MINVFETTSKNNADTKPPSDSDWFEVEIQSIHTCDISLSPAEMLTISAGLLPLKMTYI